MEILPEMFDLGFLYSVFLSCKAALRMSAGAFPAEFLFLMLWLIDWRSALSRTQHAGHCQCSIILWWCIRFIKSWHGDQLSHVHRWKLSASLRIYTKTLKNISCIKLIWWGSVAWNVTPLVNYVDFGAFVFHAWIRKSDILFIYETM